MRFSQSKLYRVPVFGAAWDNSRYLGRTRADSLEGPGKVKLRGPHGSEGAFYPEEVEEQMASPDLRLANIERERPNRYRADLVVHGVTVGRVERGWSMGGRGADRYVASVEGITVAEARTLSDLRVELTEWIEEERQMESDAVWLRMERDE